MTLDEMNKAVTRTIEFLGWRKRGYKLEIQNARESVVLRDLARYCRMNEDCPYSDPFDVGKWLGRQEVFRRIERHIYLTPEELFAIYNGVRNKENQS